NIPPHAPRRMDPPRGTTSRRLASALHALTGAAARGRLHCRELVHLDTSAIGFPPRAARCNDDARPAHDPAEQPPDRAPRPWCAGSPLPQRARDRGCARRDFRAAARYGIGAAGSCDSRCGGRHRACGSMSQTRVNRRVPRFRWRIAGLIGAGVLINYFDRISLSVAGPQLERSFHLTPVDLGMLFSAFFWSYALLQIPVGLVLDRLGVTRIGRWSTFLWSVAQVLTACAGGFA